MSHAFVGGRLNLAHAAASYLPASVMARLGDCFGRPSLLATGLDVHGRRAGRELRGGGDPREMADRAEAEFRSDLARLGVRPDVFLRTDDPEVAEITTDALEALARAGLLALRPSATFHCPACAGDLSATDLRGRSDGAAFASHAAAAEASGDLACAACGDAVEVRAARQIAFRLDRFPALGAFHHRQPGKVARKLLAALANGGFEAWEITRDNYHGLAASIDPSKALYVWFPALASKALLAQAAGMDTRSFLASDRATFFFGKNIVSYYGLVLPNLLRGWLKLEDFGFRFSVRGFCDLGPSAALLDVEAAVARHGVDAVRFFCLYSTPDDAVDFTLDPERLPIVIDSVLEKGFGRYLALARARLPFPSDPASPPPRPELWALFDRLHRRGEIRRLLLELEQFARTEARGVRDHPSARVLAGYRAVADILRAYVPEWMERQEGTA